LFVPVAYLAAYLVAYLAACLAYNAPWSSNVHITQNGVLSLVQLQVGSKPAKQLRLHPLSRLGAVSNISRDIRARGKIVFKYRLSSSASHIGKDCLPEVPSEEFGCRLSSIVQETAIQERTGDPMYIW
jgi:hypothetical protein